MRTKAQFAADRRRPYRELVGQQFKVTMARQGSDHQPARCCGLIASCTMGPEFAARKAAAKAMSAAVGFEIDDQLVVLDRIKAPSADSPQTIWTAWIRSEK